MKNMQKGGAKIIIITAFMLTLVASLHAQPSAKITNAADSLFRARQYSQSFELYKAILGQHYYSPAMLLKMAYIQEGLGHTGKSLYYLNLYYQDTDDKQALYKMEEIADKNKLEGYAATDTSRIFIILKENYIRIVQVLSAIIAVLFGLMVYARVRLHRQPYFTAFLLLLVIGVLFLHVNFSRQSSLGIITSPSTYLMSGPSSGASVVSIIAEGHKLEITGQEDVWVKVRWLDKDVYVRQNSLSPLQL